MEDNIINVVNPVKIFIKNLIVEFFISLAFLFILSILLSTTKLSEDVINPCIIFISAFSILLGSFLSGRKIKSKGIILGILQGVIYMMILYIISSVSSANFKIGIESIIMILIGIVSGAIRRDNWSKFKITNLFNRSKTLVKLLK